MASRVLERSLTDMTLPQFRVLSVIASSPERANRIAEKAAMSRPSLTGLLDGLEARGWVQRVDVEGDRRGVSLEVTSAGADALKQAERAMTAELDLVLRSSPDDRAAVTNGLTALARAIGEHHRARR
jgi:DNA-binding MarR family transcriptional regulator